MAHHDTFDNGHPYTAIAGELIADFVALGRLVEARRPEIAALPGTYHLTIDAAAGTVLLSRALGDDRVIIVERILANPADPVTFGASDLPSDGVADDLPLH